MKKIWHWKFGCTPVMPLVYEESLSYYEQICKLVHKINEVIDQLNTIDLDEVFKEVDNRIAIANEKLNKQMEYVLSQVSNLEGNVQNLLDLYKTQIDADLKRTIYELNETLNYQLGVLKAYVDSQDNKVLIKVQLLLDEFYNSLPDLTTVYVVSPYSGKIITVQEAFQEIWDYLKIYALTAYEYDSQRWTAETYDGFKMTAFNYDYYAKRFFYKNPDLYMFSPFTGEYVLVKDVVMMLAQLHRVDALDADNYDALQLEANIYDNKKVSAYNYDWKASQYLM